MHSIFLVYACLNLNSGGCPSASWGPSRVGYLPRLRTGGCGRNRLPVCGGHGGWGSLRPRHRLPGGGILFPPHLGALFHLRLSAWQVYSTSFSTEVNLFTLFFILTNFTLLGSWPGCRAGHWRHSGSAGRGCGAPGGTPTPPARRVARDARLVITFIGTLTQVWAAFVPQFAYHLLWARIL